MNIVRAMTDRNSIRERVTASLFENAVQPTEVNNKRLSCQRQRIYACNIQGRGGTKIPDLKLRTSECDWRVFFETNCRAGDEKSIAMGSQAVSLVSQQDKGLAYGTAVMATMFDPEIDSISYKSQNTEISAVTRKLSGYILTVIGGYRSPSLRLDETRRWYAELEELVQTRQRARDDVIIVAMDDNASDQSGFAFRELERMRRAILLYLTRLSLREI